MNKIKYFFFLNYLKLFKLRKKFIKKKKKNKIIKFPILFIKKKKMYVRDKNII
jgi:hypothetical protein